MAKRTLKSAIEGRWNIVSMTEWDAEYLHEETRAFIEFSPKGEGEFQFGYVRGQMDCRATERNGKPAIDFTWDGNDETEHVFGRGWAVLEGDQLEGMIFFHFGGMLIGNFERLRCSLVPRLFPDRSDCRDQ
jgi:hypothetical protein